MKLSVSFTAWILLSATDAAAAFVTRPPLPSSKNTNTQLRDVLDYRKNSYAARKLRANTIQPPPPSSGSGPEPEPVVVNPEPVAAAPDPVLALPEPAISIPEPAIAIPEPAITITLPEPDVVENVVKEVTSQVPTDRAPTIFEYFGNNMGSLRNSAKIAGGDPSKLLAKPVSPENFDAVANAKEKLNIMKNNLFGGLDVDFTKVNLPKPGETPDLNKAFSGVTMDEDFLKKSIDSLKALGGLAAGAAAGTSDFNTVLHTMIANLQLEEYGGWYVAVIAVALALGQRQAGLEEARQEFAARLSEADQKAAEAAKAATLAAEGAKMATKMASRIDANSAASILENSKLREIQVDKEMMQSALSKLKVETEALKKQLAATKTKMVSFSDFTAGMMEEMDDPDANARILALLKQVDEEKKAAAEKVKAEKIAAEKAAAEKVAAEKAAAEKIATEKAAAEKAAVEQAKAEKVAAEKAKAEKIAAEKEAVEKAKAEMIAAEKEAVENAKAEKVAEKAKADKEKAEKIEVEKAKAGKIATEKAKADKIAAEDAAAESAKTAAEKAAANQAASAEAAAPEPEPMFFGTETLKPKAASKGAKKNGKKASPAAEPEPEAPKVVKKKASTIAAEKANQATAAADPENPWKSLSPSTLKRKTAKDLTEYLEARGATGVGENGKPKTKEELVAAVQSL